MADANYKSREARVIRLLEELEKSMEQKKSETCLLTSDLEYKPKSIVLTSDFKEITNKLNDSKSRRNKSRTVLNDVLKCDPRKDRPWTSSTSTIKRVQINSLESKSSKNKNRGKGDGGHVACRESTISINSASSKVQQLRLFWDKFFLMETEHYKSTHDLIDKKSFLSEAKYEVLDKPKNKSMAKNATKYLEKSLPPTRSPISFRLMASHQKYCPHNQSQVTKTKKKIIREDSLSEIELPVSREVSTYMGKMPVCQEDFSDACSESESVYTMAESEKQNKPEEELNLEEETEERLNMEEEIKERLKENSAEWKEKLYKIFLADQITSFYHKERNSNEPDIGIYEITDDGRKISGRWCRGILYMLKGSHVLLQATLEGVIIRTDEAVFIHPAVNSQKNKRKLRKQSTLLPCYYFSYHQDPIDFRSEGDFNHHISKVNHTEDQPKSKNCKSEYPLKTLLSYEKITLDPSAIGNTTNVKIILSKDDPVAKMMTHLFIGFVSILFLSVILVVVKLLQGSQFY